MPSTLDTAAGIAWLSSAYVISSQSITIPTSSAEYFAGDVKAQTLVGAQVVLSAYLGLKIAFAVFYDTNPLATTWQLVRTFWTQENRRKINVDNFIDDYNQLHEKDVKERESSYQKLVNAYYELATQFYEWGWGQSFHFASRMADESFSQSIKRHEYYLASRLNVPAGSKILDCGCGIGGPYRNISRFTQSDVTGITINEYQVLRGNELNKMMGLTNCRSVQGDFMKLPFKDNEFDAIYAIEATCHAPLRQDCYREFMRVLKPGGVFASYEWCLTDKYDSKSEEDRRIKKLIEEGDGLPDMITCRAAEQAAVDVGFKVVESRDMVDDEHIHTPWYTPLTPSYNILSQRFQFTPIGMWLTRVALTIMETIYLAPKGTCKVQAMLQRAAVGLAEGGVKKVFTPMFLLVVQKPEEKKNK